MLYSRRNRERPKHQYTESMYYKPQWGGEDEKPETWDSINTFGESKPTETIDLKPPKPLTILEQASLGLQSVADDLETGISAPFGWVGKALLRGQNSGQEVDTKKIDQIGDKLEDKVKEKVAPAVVKLGETVLSVTNPEFAPGIAALNAIKDKSSAADTAISLVESTTGLAGKAGNVGRFATGGIIAGQTASDIAKGKPMGTVLANLALNSTQLLPGDSKKVQAIKLLGDAGKFVAPFTFDKEKEEPKEETQNKSEQTPEEEKQLEEFTKAVESIEKEKDKIYTPELLDKIVAMKTVYPDLKIPANVIKQIESRPAYNNQPMYSNPKSPNNPTNFKFGMTAKDPLSMETIPSWVKIFLNKQETDKDFSPKTLETIREIKYNYPEINIPKTVMTEIEKDFYKNPSTMRLTVLEPLNKELYETNSDGKVPDWVKKNFGMDTTPEVPDWVKAEFAAGDKAKEEEEKKQNELDSFWTKKQSEADEKAKEQNDQIPLKRTNVQARPELKSFYTNQQPQQPRQTSVPITEVQKPVEVQKAIEVQKTKTIIPVLTMDDALKDKAYFDNDSKIVYPNYSGQEQIYGNYNVVRPVIQEPVRLEKRDCKKLKGKKKKKCQQLNKKKNIK